MTLFEEAVQFALEAHRGQVRKLNELPYIIHPMEVATICATLTSDPEVLAAAVLHDTVEDTDTTMEALEARFGQRVALLVASETEPPCPGLSRADSWHVRKENSLALLKTAADPGVKILWLGDKLSNIRSFYRVWQISGHEVWSSLNQKDPAMQAWYYRSIVTLLAELKDTPAWQELHSKVEQVFRDIS